MVILSLLVCRNGTLQDLVSQVNDGPPNPVELWLQLWLLEGIRSSYGFWGSADDTQKPLGSHN